MTEHLPVRREDDFLPLLPPAMAGLGRDGARAFRDYFTGQIRNANTRAAYSRAVGRFCACLDERGVELRDVEAVHIAAFIEWMPGARRRVPALRASGRARVAGVWVDARAVWRKRWPGPRDPSDLTYAVK